MKSIIRILVLCVLAVLPASGLSPAAQAAGRDKGGAGLMVRPHQIETLNNVVSLDPKGGRSALCLCGKTFAVSEDSPTIQREGTNFFLCSQECNQTTGKVADKDWSGFLSGWKKKFADHKFPSNARMKQGREVATCLCGKTFDVNYKTQAVADNGMVIHFCSQTCWEKFHNLSANDQLVTELALLPQALKEPNPSAEVIYRYSGEAAGTAAAAAPSTGR